MKRGYEALKKIPFGSNAMRFSIREIVMLTVLILAAGVWGIPALYRSWERVSVSDDFRLAESLRDDYWIYERCLNAPENDGKILFFGDSVIWGMYADNGNTLPAWINAEAQRPIAANFAIDGLHQVAMLKLLNAYAGNIKGKTVVLHFNPLWMNTPRYDLSEAKQPGSDESSFSPNHPRLLPQMDWTIHAYQESFSNRISIVLEHILPLPSLLHHLRLNYCENQSIPEYFVNNVNEIPEFQDNFDASEKKKRNGTRDWQRQHIPIQDWPWVTPEESRQVAAFIDAIQIMKKRKNQVIVTVGAINEWMLSEASRCAYHESRNKLIAILNDTGADEVIVFSLLPSEEYADGSHPLAAGYHRMAEELLAKSKILKAAVAANHLQEKENRR